MHTNTVLTVAVATIALASASAIPAGPFSIINERQDRVLCQSFKPDSQEDVNTEQKQVSDIIDCLNGDPDAGCKITIEKQHTEEFTTNFSFSGGGELSGGVGLGASVGEGYSQSETTTEQAEFSIEAGQQGYLASYCAATQFTGTYTMCTDDQEHAGTCTALKEGELTYIIVNTSGA